MAVQIIPKVQYFTVSIPLSFCITSIYIYLWRYNTADIKRTSMQLCMHAMTMQYWTVGKKTHVVKNCPTMPWLSSSHMEDGNSRCNLQKLKQSVEKGALTLHVSDNYYHSSVWINYSGWTKCLHAKPMHSFPLLV